MPEVEYEWPDGQIIRVAEERFRCPEAMFDPSLDPLTHAFAQTDGLHQLLNKTIMECDEDIRRDMYGHNYIGR